MSAPEDLDGLDQQERIDRFACAALAGILATPHEGGSLRTPKGTALWAYDYAVAMEAERAKRLA